MNNPPSEFPSENEVPKPQLAKGLIGRILASAAAVMWEVEPTLSGYTAETAQHELNIAFHYASRLRRWFPWLDCDFDVQKRSWANSRPDIIFHRRGTHDENFLVLEVKRANNLAGGIADIYKIRERWFSKPLCYRFGASVVFDEQDESGHLCVLSADDPAKEPLLHLPMAGFAHLAVPRSDKEGTVLMNDLGLHRP